MASEPPADLFDYAGIGLPEPADRVSGLGQTSGAARAASGRVRGARRTRSKETNQAEPVPSGAEIVIAFPNARNVRKVQELAREFITLRQFDGDSCRKIFARRRFEPLGARLRRIGVSEHSVQRELACLEAAVAKAVWISDGCPRFEAGGGSAA